MYFFQNGDNDTDQEVESLKQQSSVLRTHNAKPSVTSKKFHKDGYRSKSDTHNSVMVLYKSCRNYTHALGYCCSISDSTTVNITPVNI